MSQDIRRLVVALIAASGASVVLWFFSDAWMARLAIRVAGDGSEKILAYLPSWVYLLRELLPGVLVGLLATRWQLVSAAVVSYVFALIVILKLNYSLFSSALEILLGKPLLYAAYGAVGAMAGCYLRSSYSTKSALRSDVAG